MYQPLYTQQSKMYYSSYISLYVTCLYILHYLWLKINMLAIWTYIYHSTACQVLWWHLGFTTSSWDTECLDRYPNSSCIDTTRNTRWPIKRCTCKTHWCIHPAWPMPQAIPTSILAMHIPEQPPLNSYLDYHHHIFILSCWSKTYNLVIMRRPNCSPSTMSWWPHQLIDSWSLSVWKTCGYM